MQLEVKCDGILACTLPAQLKPSPRPRATRGHHPLIIDLRLTAGVSAKPGPHPFIQSSPTVTREKLITRTIQELQWCRSHVLGSDSPDARGQVLSRHAAGDIESTLRAPRTARPYIRRKTSIARQLGAERAPWREYITREEKKQPTHYAILPLPFNLPTK
ncbi:hypothetical protein RRG08_061130 [Elysia crispata]|uniref:Uncharacterized protein n=1 Tax=Elysia crispata TaxID=231223 RepID=A0AAE1CEA6_9GAST|nr:hypothetical protein RRG08_061130 [Elysia crispata]